jgi:hypothetical protein
MQASHTCDYEIEMDVAEWPQLRKLSFSREHFVRILSPHEIETIWIWLFFSDDSLEWLRLAAAAAAESLVLIDKSQREPFVDVEN